MCCAHVYTVWFMGLAHKINHLMSNSGNCGKKLVACLHQGMEHLEEVFNRQGLHESLEDLQTVVEKHEKSDFGGDFCASQQGFPQGT